tara:strand:- start:22 stop:198 length:177 start_codon:yes stop_codon:yes gene_type:complete
MPTEEQVEDLVEYLLNCMDMEALESFVRDNLTQYYSSNEGKDDFDTNYAEMREIRGDE